MVKQKTKKQTEDYQKALIGTLESAWKDIKNQWSVEHDKRPSNPDVVQKLHDQMLNLQTDIQALKNGERMYEGIADCYGIESFVMVGKSRFPYKMRADLNRQRHAIYYRVMLTSVQVKKVEDLLKKKNFEKAFIMIKNFGKMKVPNSHRKSVFLIPNPKLDPFGSD